MKKAGKKTVDIENNFLCMRMGNNNFIYIYYYICINKPKKRKNKKSYT